MIHVVKIGGNVIDDPEALSAFLKSFVALGGHKILVHGGGKMATQLAEKLNFPQKMVDGRRVTDKDTLDVITMVYAGLINKNIVAGLQAMGCNSLGVCGADANIIEAEKRPVKDVDFGFVGDIKHVKGETISGWLQKGITPVVAPVCHDGKGSLLNTNADTIASSISVSLSQLDEVRLIYCFEKKGVLLDVEDDESVLPDLNEQKIEALKSEDKIHSGMLPKLDNALETLKNGVQSVFIGSADELSLLAQGKSGTKIVV